MRKVAYIALKLTKQVTKVAVENEKKGIYSLCPTLLHQPKRPKKQMK